MGEELLEEEDDIDDKALFTTLTDFDVESFDDSITELAVFCCAVVLIIWGFGGRNQS